ncbi:helix-turn-helix transcriptional regulator [bacterium]|nr:helix-turn-helix transcriptional regulator [bacterium]
MVNLKEKLGAKIQEIRKAKHITQEKLAEMINMDTSNLSNIERGKKFMTSVTMEKLVKSLNITEKELFDFEHILPEDELKKTIIKKLDNMSYTELQFLYKTMNNIPLIRK